MKKDKDKVILIEPEETAEVFENLESIISAQVKDAALCSYALDLCLVLENLLSSFPYLEI